MVYNITKIYTIPTNATFESGYSKYSIIAIDHYSHFLLFEVTGGGGPVSTGENLTSPTSPEPARTGSYLIPGAIYERPETLYGFRIQFLDGYMDLTDCPLIGDPVDIEGMKKGIFDYDNPNAIVVHPVGESGFFTPFHIKYKVLHSTCYYDPTDIDTELLFDIKDNNQLRQFLRSVIVASG